MLTRGRGAYLWKTLLSTSFCNESCMELECFNLAPCVNSWFLRQSLLLLLTSETQQRQLTLSFLNARILDEDHHAPKIFLNLDPQPEWV